MGTEGVYVFVQWQTSLQENAHGHMKQFEVPSDNDLKYFYISFPNVLS